MKVGYLTNCFGTQSHTFIRNEINGLQDLGVDIRLYGIRRDDTIAPDATHFVEQTKYLYPLQLLTTLGSTFHYLLKSPGHFLSGLGSALCSKEFGLKRRFKMLYHYILSTRIAREMQRDGITLIHSHFMNVSTSIAMYAAHHSKIPFSVTVHSAGTYRTPHILGMHQKLRQAQFLIMISHYNINYCDAIEPCRQKSHVIRCGMDLNMFHFKPRPSVRPIPKILGVGRFVQKKGFIYLIEAAAILRDQGKEFQLTIVGDGPLAPQLKKRVTDLGLEQMIEFTGQRDSEYVRDTMQQSDIVVVPSVTSDSGEKEGLPVVIMEAMATGIPVIATDHSAIGEVVQAGITGHLIREKDTKGIADAVEQICLNDNSEMIAAAHQLIKTHFEIGVVASQRLELFKQYSGESQ